MSRAGLLHTPARYNTPDMKCAFLYVLSAAAAMAAVTEPKVKLPGGHADLACLIASLKN